MALTPRLEKTGYTGSDSRQLKMDRSQESSLAERPIQTLRIHAMVKLDCWTCISEAADSSGTAQLLRPVGDGGTQRRGGFDVRVFLSQQKNDS